MQWKSLLMMHHFSFMFISISNWVVELFPKGPWNHITELLQSSNRSDGRWWRTNNKSKTLIWWNFQWNWTMSTKNIIFLSQLKNTEMDWEIVAYDDLPLELDFICQIEWRSQYHSIFNCSKWNFIFYLFDILVIDYHLLNLKQLIKIRISIRFGLMRIISPSKWMMWP